MTYLETLRACPAPLPEPLPGDPPCDKHGIYVCREAVDDASVDAHDVLWTCGTAHGTDRWQNLSDGAVAAYVAAHAGWRRVV